VCIGPKVLPKNDFDPKEEDVKDFVITIVHKGQFKNISL